MLAPAAPGSPPRSGTLVPGKTLGGVRLGMTRSEVRRAWGGRFGVCRGCPDETWYYTYRPRKPQGAGISFRGGRVVAVFTHWAPRGWRTTSGVAIGDSVARLVARHGAMPRTQCSSYSVLTSVRGPTATLFYVVDEKVWGFGLQTTRVGACR